MEMTRRDSLSSDNSLPSSRPDDEPFSHLPVNCRPAVRTVAISAIAPAARWTHARVATACADGAYGPSPGYILQSVYRNGLDRPDIGCHYYSPKEGVWIGKDSRVSSARGPFAGRWRRGTIRSGSEEGGMGMSGQRGETGSRLALGLQHSPRETYRPVVGIPAHAYRIGQATTPGNIPDLHDRLRDSGVPAPRQHGTDR